MKFRPHRFLFRSIRRHPKTWLLLVFLMAFPYTWGPWIAGKVARYYLDLDEPGSSEITVDRISLFRIKAHDMRIGAVSGTPVCKTLDIHFTPWGLAKGRIDSIEAQGLAVDAGAFVPKGFRGRVPDTATDLNVLIEAREGGYSGEAHGRVLGGPAEGAVDFDNAKKQGTLAFSFLPGVEGFTFPEAMGRDRIVNASNGRALTAPRILTEADFKLDGAPTGVLASANAHIGLEATRWGLNASLDVSTNKTISATAKIAPTSFTETDPLISDLLAMSGATGSVATISGTIAADFSLRKEPKAAVAEWTANANIESVDTLLFENSSPLTLQRGNIRAALAGWGGHVDIKPVNLSFGEATCGTLQFDRARFSLRTDDEAFLLTHGQADFCGGQLSLFNVRLDTKTLDAGFTMLLDDIDAGRVLSMFPGINGTATGRLHGKLPLYLRNGSELRLRNAFLYSPPGESGTLKLRDASGIIDPVRSSGVPAETCSHLQAALQNLTYSVLRLDLTRDPRTDSEKLALHVEGNGSDGKLTIPVDLTVNFSGDLQKSLNIGLRASGITKKRR